MEFKIPQMPIEIKEPKIPFTNIPNPIGAAVYIYPDGWRRLIPAYYIQKLIRRIFNILIFPFKMLKLLYCKRRIKKGPFIINKEEM